MGVIFLVALFTQTLFFGDFQSENKILVPFDHHLKDSKKIEISIEYLNGFDPKKETVFLLEDSFDKQFVQLYELLDFPTSLNFIWINGRQSNESIIKDIEFSGDPDYSLAYRILNQDQIARDIELVRKEILGDQKVILFGFSSAATVLQYYLSLFPEHVKRAVFINPLVFDVQKNLSFPKSSSRFLGDKLRADQLFDFNYYANFQSINNSRKEVQLASTNNLIQFLTFQNLLDGVSRNSSHGKNYPLLVRIFEHSLAMSDLQNVDEQNDIYGDFLKRKSEVMWRVYSESNFKVFGTNYDKIREFSGKVILIGSVYDQLIYPKSYDALAEFFSDCTLLLLNDGHALQKIVSANMMTPLLTAFLEDDVAKKIEVYNNLSEGDHLFRNYKEGRFKIPPPF